MLIGPGRRIFVGQRADGAGAEWQMPQGGIDSGESVLEAPARELVEETGTSRALLLDVTDEWITYDVPRALARRVWGGRYRGQAQRWAALAFTGTDADIVLDGPHREFRAWRWLDPAALPDAVVPFKRGLYCQVLSRFARWLA